MTHHSVDEKKVVHAVTSEMDKNTFYSYYISTRDNYGTHWGNLVLRFHSSRSFTRNVEAIIGSTISVT